MGKWILADERMPDSSNLDWLLIVIEFNEPGMSRAVRIGYYDADRQAWRTQWGQAKGHWQITHWMPLPELPSW